MLLFSENKAMDLGNGLRVQVLVDCACRGNIVGPPFGVDIGEKECTTTTTVISSSPSCSKIPAMGRRIILMDSGTVLLLSVSVVTNIETVATVLLTS